MGELLAIFRGSIVAVIPWLEKARIKWTDKESYDDYDDICSTLYATIVLKSLYGEDLSEYPIAKYGFQYDDYSKIDFISVKRPEQDTRLAFVFFESITSPLDNVHVAVLDKSFKVINFTTLEGIEWEFEFVSNRTGHTETKNEINVLL